MAKLTLGQKADRVLALLLGLRIARVAAALGAHGFKNEDLAEGWTLLRAVGKTKLDAEPEPTALDANALQTLDEWENLWLLALIRAHCPCRGS